MRASLLNAIGATFIALTLAACGPSDICSSENEAAQYLAKLSADVQSATLSNKLSMGELKQLTGDVDAAGRHYSVSKNPAEFCQDLAQIRETFRLPR